ncbi:MAG: SusE domain-containing protein [Muribaculaceae bacterium]|nr:SusE domain-containing protein [Muribaculaceae bacterium]
MKKLIYLWSLIALIAVTATSCKEDTEPRLEKPTEFVLNTPAMAENTYILSADNGLDLSVSQANYGLGVVPVYTVEIAKSADFAEKQAVEGRYTSAAFTVPGEALSLAMCMLWGYDSRENFDGSGRPLYVRVVSDIANVSYATITSNVVELKSVKPYFAVKLPAKMWLIGQPQGWDINNGSMELSEPENGIGSNIYTGTFEVSAADAASGFRFYTELGNWGKDGELPSVGSAANDGDNQSVALDGETYEGSCVYGKGNWNLTNWPGGTMKITVNLNTMQVIFQHVN